MGSFSNVREYAEGLNTGKLISSSFRKVPSQASVAGWWTDLSMAAGNPLPNYYASNPLQGAVLSGWRGVFHGADKTPAEKYLTELMLCTATANMVGTYRLMDYLLYYPFVDLDDPNTQIMDEDITPVELPRYSGGEGVLPMMVTVAPTTGGGSFTFDYLDQDGNEKTSPVNYYSVTAANIAAIVTSEQGQVSGGRPYLLLASGTRGVRRILRLTNLVSNGGLGAIVLVRPLVDIDIAEASTPSELTLVSMQACSPRIYDGAYLNFICNTIGTIAAGLLTGRVNFTWK